MGNSEELTTSKSVQKIRATYLRVINHKQVVLVIYNPIAVCFLCVCRGIATQLGFPKKVKEEVCLKLPIIVMRE